MPAGDASSWAAYNVAATHVSRRQTVQPSRPHDATVYGQPGTQTLSVGVVFSATAPVAGDLTVGVVFNGSAQVVRP